MDIETIKTILTVAHCENYAEAARKLGYTPSVISKRIIKTEQELNIPLFARGRRASSLAPTAECEAILPDLKAIDEAWGRIQDTAVMLSQTENEGELRIGSLAKYYPTREDSIISDFMTKYRNVNVLVVKQSWDPLIRGLHQGSYDLAFLSFNGTLRHLEGDWPDAQLDKFDFYLVDTLDTMYVAIGSQFPEASLGEATLEDLKDYTFAFNVGEKGDILKNHAAPFLELAGRYGFALKARPLNTRDGSAFLTACNRKLAIPQPVCQTHVEGITHVRLTDWPTHLSAYCVIPKGKHSPLVVHMINHLKAHGCELDSLPNRR